jgi:hypothetical protein
VWGRAFGRLGAARVGKGVFGGLDGEGARCKGWGIAMGWDIWIFSVGNKDGEPIDVCSVYLLTQHPPDGAMSFLSMSS